MQDAQNGRPARDTEKATVEVKTEGTERPNCRLGRFLSLSLNLDLHNAGELFQRPASTL